MRELAPTPSARDAHDAHDAHEGAAAAACAPDAVVTLDPAGRVTWLNAAAEQLLGWTAAELVGRPAAVLVPGDRVDEAAALQRGLPDLADTVTLETERLHRSGARVPVALRVAPLLRDGRRDGSVAVLRDMSSELVLRRELRYTRRIAESRFEQSVVAKASLAPDGTVVQVNDRLCELAGCPAGELVGRSYQEFLLPAEVEDAACDQAHVLDGALRSTRNARMLRRADGAYVETVVSLSALHDDDGAVARLEVAIEDVSAVRAAERALRASENRWRALALRSSDVAFLADADGGLLFVSPSLSEHFGYDAGDVVGRSGFEFFHPEDLPLVRSRWEQAVGLVGTPVTFRARARHADGAWRWVEETATNWLSDPDIGAVVANVTDVTALVHAERRSGAGSADPLTGLGTRATALVDLARLLAATRPPAVLVVDVDAFSEVNAAYGHAVGDVLLTQVGRRLTGAVGEPDSVARLDGDRFAVLLAGPTDDVLEATVARVTAALRDRYDVPDGDVRMTAAVGVLLAADAAVAGDPTDVMALAESALRTAKQRGPGSVHVHDGTSPLPLARRARTVSELGRGLRRGEVVAHYQPLVELGSGRTVGAEALARWQHPERGLLPPAEFIDAAETSGLIVELGARVLEQACRAAATWAQQDLFGGPFHLAVNLSARQLAQPEVVDLVRDTLAATGAQPRHLVLEVTESTVMDDLDRTSAVLGELRALGVGLAVDDFGTGYSSLTYLRRFPVTALKIDRSFVAGLGVDADDAAIVTSIVQLARAIGLGCVAEGVETDEQAALLRRSGCTLGQGYLWSRPVDGETFAAWVRRRPATAPRTDASDRRRSVRAAAPTPVTAAAVERIAQLQAEGASLHTVAAALNAEGLLTPEGRRWHPRSIARVVADLAAADRS